MLKCILRKVNFRRNVNFLPHLPFRELQTGRVPRKRKTVAGYNKAVRMGFNFVSLPALCGSRYRKRPGRCSLFPSLSFPERFGNSVGKEREGTAERGVALRFLEV